jgi:hypothetical protein
MKKFVIVLGLLAIAGCWIPGCATITPQEMARFQTQLDRVKTMSIQCTKAPTKELACQGLAEAVVAMESFVTAASD